MTEVVLLIYCKGSREGAVLRSQEAVHSGLMRKYQIDITGSRRDRITKGVR